MLKLSRFESHRAKVARRAIEKMTNVLKKITSAKGREFREVHKIAKHKQVLSTNENDDLYLP